MLNSDTVTFLKEEYESDKTGEKVQGVTIIVDGKLKEAFDILIKKKNYNDYTEIVRDSLFEGFNVLVTKK